MPTAYRVLSRDGTPIGDADSIDGVVAIAQAAPPGRYRIDLVATDPNSGEQRSRNWGAVIKSRKGRITLEVPPWAD
jgi:hypothetical protein